MEIGIEKLDKLIGPLSGGSVLLIEDTGGIGAKICSVLVDRHKDSVPTLLIFQKGSSEIKLFPKENLRTIIIGEDAHSGRLYEILHEVRKLPENSLVVAIRLDSLLLVRSLREVYMFLSDLASVVHEKDLILVMTVDKRNIKEREQSVFENLSTHVIDISEVVSEFRVFHLLRVKKSPAGSTGFYKLEMKRGEIKIHELINTL